MKEKKFTEKDERKILRAYFNFYTGKMTLARAAQDEGIPVHFLLKYQEMHDGLFIDDDFGSLKTILILMKKKGMIKL